MKLHIGSRVRSEGWKTLDINPGPEVDFVGDCRSLAQFPDASIETIYASHVLEHIPHRLIHGALTDWLRVLEPGGTAMISVPDFELLTRLYLHPQVKPENRLFIMMMIFGGQIDSHDFHYVGLDQALLAGTLQHVGFVDIARVEDFGLFDDTSRMKYLGVPISLNVVARKPRA